MSQEKLAGAISALKQIIKKSNYVTVTNSEGKKVTTNSPKATGVPKNFKMGTTRSGKTIHSFPDHQDHAKFTHHDHADAYRAHVRHLSELDAGDTHKNLLTHHKEALHYHYKQAFAHQVQKSVTKKAVHHRIGKTKSGKQIHRDYHANHPKYDGYSKDDHVDAAHAHHKRVDRLVNAMIHFHGKSPKMVKVLQRLIKKHGNHAHGHHARAHERHSHSEA